MDEPNSDDGRSGSSYDDCEMEDASWSKQWAILNELEMHSEAIQSLIKGQKMYLQQSRSQCKNGNNVDFENSLFLSDISCHAGKICKAADDEEISSFSLTRSLLLSRNNTNQGEESSMDIQALAEKTLHNSVVLRTIMNHLDKKDLFRARLVNKSWKEEADIQLRSGPPWYQLGFYWEDSKFQNVFKKGTLEDFTKSCYDDPPRKFPCSSFGFTFFLDVVTNSIEYEDDEEIEESYEEEEDFEEKALPDLFNFLSNYGHQIKKLSLKFFNNLTSLKIVHKIIFEKIPHLQSLLLNFDLDDDEKSLQDFQRLSKSKGELGNSAVSLNCLQQLEIMAVEPRSLVASKRCKQLVSLILSSAPNLKRVTDHDLYFTEEIVVSGKIRAVNSVCLYSEMQANLMPRFVDFSRALPQLTNLQLSYDEFFSGEKIPKFLPSLQLILESSKMTLKTLSIFSRLHFNFEQLNSMEMLLAHQKFVVPILENLEDFVLDYWDSFKGGAGLILPTGFSFQVLFPKLKTLAFDSINNEEENYEVGKTDNPFTNHSNSSTTVEKLTVSPIYESFFHLEWISQSRILYPNVRVLYLEIQNNGIELPQICSRIWTSWNNSSLEELKIILYCSKKGFNSKFVEAMDQAMTGFDVKTCMMLRKESDSEIRQGNERFERNSSILDMSGLKLFELDSRSSSNRQLFSRVSVIHAFDPMKKRQNLGVVINGLELEERIQERNVDFSPVVQGD